MKRTVMGKLRIQSFTATGKLGMFGVKNMIRRLFFIFIVIPFNVSSGRPDSIQTNHLLKSETGHWLTVRMGTLSGGTDHENPWTIIGGYEGRFSANWSVPIELQVFRLNNNLSIKHEISAAMKFRIPVLRPMTNLYVQGGMSSGFTVGPTLHYAGGVEWGIFDRMSINLQAKKFINIDIDPIFFTAGINIDVTSR